MSSWAWDIGKKEKACVTTWGVDFETHGGGQVALWEM